MQQPKRNIRVLALSLATVVSASALIHGQTKIPTTYRLPSTAGDSSKPGFVWNMHQVSSGQPNSLAFTEAQLAGLKGDNIADPSAQGIALDVGKPPNPATAPIFFEIATVINLDKVAGSHGAFTPDDQMPGQPGPNGFTDNTAAEVLTYLDLPAGTNTMGVNSDDGFRVTIGGGAPLDKFNGVNVGQFDGGRGAADTIFTFVVQQAGIYAARMIWENGGGDANVEWFTVASDGTTKVLVNDVASEGIKAYRAVTTPPPKAYVRTALPIPGNTGAGPNDIIKAEIVDGATPIDTATVKLSLDGTLLTVTPTKLVNVTTVSYTPTTLYVSGSPHSVALVYNDGGNSVTQNWSFAAAVYATIPPNLRVTPDTSKAGFVMNIFANSVNQQNSNARTEASLSGLLIDPADGVTPLANLADPAAQGAALAASTAPNPPNAAIKFEIASVINLNQNAAAQTNGTFAPDLQFPGIPPTDGISDGYAAEFLTYVNLPAGLVTMGVNSDDGFRTTIGFDALSSLFLGEFDGGRGASDTIFNFFVQEAGVYPMRTIYEEGGGDSNIEWFSVKADGTTKVLVNSSTSGALKAYRALAGPVNPYVKYIAPGKEPRQVNQPSSKVLVVLADGTNPVDLNSIVLKIDGQTVTTTKVREGSLVKVTYSTTTLQVPTDVHNADLTFKDSTGNFTSNQQWQFRNLKNLVLPAPKITEDFDSYPEDTQPPGWVAWNFTAHNLDGRDITDQKSESYENWVLVNTNNAPLIDGNVLNVAPGQTFNGQPVDTISGGNILYAESDSRDNPDTRGGPNFGETQFIVSKPFDCSQITNVVLTFSALYEQNQDSYGGVEYSVDGGATWLPIVYYLDSVDAGGDIKYKPDGSVDAVATFTAPNNDTSHWITNGVLHGAGANGYGDGVGAPITQALADYIAPRLNDNSSEGARIEVFRLSQAGKKSDVRLRFSAMGTDSWWFAVDNIAFYDVAPSVPTAPVFNPITRSGNSITIAWTGTGTLEETTALGGTWSTSPSQNNPQTVTVTTTGNKFYRLKQ